MPVLQWSDALSLDLPLMDDTHREFVDLLAVVGGADDDALLAAWDALVEHTQDHFDREDQWMGDTRFASGNCHSTQHKVVLAVMREGGKRGRSGDLVLVRQLADELALWFPQHAQTMDAALALHLRGVGYDPATGEVTLPDALPDDVIHGCGGSCGDVPAPTADARAAAQA